MSHAMHTAFHASSHHGRHQAPVLASTTSDAPKHTNTIAARTHRPGAAWRKRIAAAAKITPINVHSTASA